MAEMNIWDEFDKTIDIDGLRADIEEASSGNGTYKEVPHGEYEVKIEKMELTATKEARKPMVSIWFKIVAGDYKNSMIFMNQVITEGFQIHIVNEFLRSLDTDVNVEFKTYNQYGNLLMDIKEALDESGVEFALDYGENSKGYPTFEITEVFEAE
mgnify:FL=1